ncbi:MAG: hypothetical protein Q8K72_02065 [Acidimicrobiales bacterium]|nr:hypothetical protein [Acidimicrobiales bacterium]
MIREREVIGVWKRSPEDPVVTLAADLTLECDAILAGRYADYLCSRGRPAPPWTWVNALAHRSASDLAALAGGDDRPGADRTPDAQQWRQALAYLADDVVSQVQESGITVGQLQRTRLIALELELCRNPDRCTDPGQLAGLVMAVVRRRPSRRQP